MNFSLSGLVNSARELRASIAPKNETERRMYEALGSQNWGASSSLLAEIAEDSFGYDSYKQITALLWPGLDTEARSWKQLFKALTLIEYLIKNGSERVVEDARDRIRDIRRLQDYNFFEGHVDRGSGCRELSKRIVEILESNDTIREERNKAKELREKFGKGNRGSIGGGGMYGANDRRESGGYGGDRRDGGDSRGYGNDSRGGGSGGGGFGSSGFDDRRDRPYSDGNDTNKDRRDSGGFGSDSRGVGGGGAGGGSSYGDGGIDGEKYRRDRNNRDGGDTWRNSGGGGRYEDNKFSGGGAYSSDRPGRYSDEAPSNDSNNNNNNNSSSNMSSNNNGNSNNGSNTGDSYNRDFIPYYQDKLSSTSGNAGGGKFKINIKSMDAPASTNNNAVDLFADAPTATSSNNNSNNSALQDLFGAAPAPVQQQAADPFGGASFQQANVNPIVPQQQQQAFDPFAIAPTNVGMPPQQQATTVFDPFASAPQQQQQQVQQQQMGTNQQPQMNLLGGSPMAPPMGGSPVFGGGAPMVPQMNAGQAQPMQGMPGMQQGMGGSVPMMSPLDSAPSPLGAPPPIPTTMPTGGQGDDGFGDFESSNASNNTQTAPAMVQAKPKDPVLDGGLVNLGNLGAKPAQTGPPGGMPGMPGNNGGILGGFSTAPVGTMGQFAPGLPQMGGMPGQMPNMMGAMPGMPQMGGQMGMPQMGGVMPQMMGGMPGQMPGGMPQMGGMPGQGFPQFAQPGVGQQMGGMPGFAQQAPQGFPQQGFQQQRGSFGSPQAGMPQQGMPQQGGFNQQQQNPFGGF